MGYSQLTTDERYRIAAMRAQRTSTAEIAAELGRHRSTIYREVKRNVSAHDGAYRPSHAVEKANGRRSRSRRNAHFGEADFGPVEALIRQDWSPVQIVGRRRRDGHVVMSHETIYCWIWADKERGGTLWRHLRGARKQRRKRYARYDSRGRLAGKRMITERPPAVDQRARFGDWEIDTVHGRGKPCVVTAVERRSGLIRIGKLPRAAARDTTDRTIEILTGESHPIRSITADNGSEFHGYRQIESALGTRFYFATPHHAWERGTNENTNGLLRQYLPKGSCLRRLTQQQCDEIAAHLNRRPRLRHGFRTPFEMYYDSIRPRRR